MPNQVVDRNLSQALQNAFGGRQPAAAQQPSAPPAPSPEGSAGGPSLWQSLMNAVKPNPSPYDNLANKATGKDYK